MVDPQSNGGVATIDSIFLLGRMRVLCSIEFESI